MWVKGGTIGLPRLHLPFSMENFELVALGFFAMSSSVCFLVLHDPDSSPRSRATSLAFLKDRTRDMSGDDATGDETQAVDPRLAAPKMMAISPIGTPNLLQVEAVEREQKSTTAAAGQVAAPPGSTVASVLRLVRGQLETRRVLDAWIAGRMGL